MRGSQERGTTIDRAFFIILGCGLSGSGLCAEATQTATFDLSPHADSRLVSVKAGDVQVILRNLLPKETTTYELKSETVTIDVLPAPLVSPFQPAPPPGAVAALPTECEKAKQELDKKLLDARDEKAVADLEPKYAGLKTVCTPEETKTALTNFQARTTIALVKVSLSEGQQHVVTVTRNENEPKSIGAKDFGSYTIATPGLPSQWLVFYGVNFVNSDDEDFFSKENSGTPTTYTITMEADRESWAFAPSVYFMWLPSRNNNAAAWRYEKSTIFGGITAGLGFDSSNPTAFLGYGVGWGYNLLVTAGVVMHKEERLNGQYNPGDVIEDNLTQDQLSTEAYKARVYIGLAFRFGSNPFAKK